LLVALVVHKLRVYKIELFMAVFSPSQLVFPNVVEGKFLLLSCLTSS